ncbi:NAD(P)H-quinone oxidoreductase subunit I, chloroplastic [subsurface metagenome]
MVVSLPKLKTHELTFLTGAVKNFFGCVPSGDRFRAHRLSKEREFAEAVVDIYSVCRPKLAVMDAVVVMEGEGPSAGDPTNVGAILASFDCVSLDVVASQLTSFRPEEILTSVDAIERGIGPEGLEEVRTVGEELKGLIKKDFKKPVLYRNSAVRSLRRLLTPLGINIFRVFPKLNQSRCSRCGLCEEKCSVGAIRLDPLPLINYEECIQCFVCHEFCPEGAIELKRSWIARRLQRR